MIFTTDLDGTVVFSKRWITEDLCVKAVERRMGEAVGFMHEKAYESLCSIQKKTVFVANTLRGIEQAKRIQFVNDEFCDYIVTQNGLYIYQNGKLLTKWSRQVQKEFQNIAFGLPQAIKKIIASICGIECLSKQYEYMAVFFIKEEVFDFLTYTQIRQELADFGWDCYVQRRKLYISPKQIDKAQALHFIQEQENENQCCGFGDSYFDIPMLAACSTRYSILDSELYQNKPDFEITFSNLPGVRGSEEILNKLAIL